MSRLISLASGALPEFTPLETVDAAITAGWPAVGLTIDPAAWSPSIAASIKNKAAGAGLTILDVEVIWLKPGADDPDHLAIIDAGGAIGARNVLVVSSDTPEATVGKLVTLAEHAAQYAMRLSLEFAGFTAVRSLAAALDILDRTDDERLGLLIDPLHFTRTGGVPDNLRSVDPGRFAYAQFCDAVLTGPPPSDIGAIISEALDGRLEVGAGELPLKELLAALPAGIPLSIELRSKAMRELWPGAADRARALLASTRAGFGQS